jgi:hypothetical protein
VDDRVGPQVAAMITSPNRLPLRTLCPRPGAHSPRHERQQPPASSSAISRSISSSRSHPLSERIELQTRNSRFDI